MTSAGNEKERVYLSPQVASKRNGIRHILWDWNGTLLDDVALCVSALNRVCDRRGIPHLTIERYREIFTFPVSDYYKAAGFDFDKEPFSVPADEWVDIYCNEVWEASRLHDGVVEVLDFCRAHGYSQSMLSAHHHDTLARLVEFFGVADYFNDVVGLGDFYADGKTELGKAWLNNSGLRPDTILMIGDTLHDHEVAEALGVHCVLISGGHQSARRLHSSGARVLDRLEDVLSFLGKPTHEGRA